MKYTFIDAPVRARFEELGSGEWFKHVDCPFMKTDKIVDHANRTWNCVSLAGIYGYIEAATTVFLLDGEVSFWNKGNDIQEERS